jgi:single-strand DNA-binding protein
MADLRLPTLNYVVMAGRLTRDPDLRYTPSGAAVCNFGLASNRRYKDQSGEWKDDSTFVNIVTWTKTAENCGQYLKKGSPVLVEGTLQSRSWETEDGQKRSVIEIKAFRVQFLERAGTGAGEEGPSPEGTEGGDAPPADEAIPF